MPGVESVGAGPDGDAAQLTITVTPDSSPAHADELLDEGVRQLWQSDLEPLSGIRVVVSPSSRAEGQVTTELVHDEQDLERVPEDLVEQYGNR